MSERARRDEQFDMEQAERFDEALERAQADHAQRPDDPELTGLVELALQLERDLPEDLPDPGFRERLGRDLTGIGDGAGASAPVREPVDLAAGRRHPFSPFDWRVGAVAAMVAVFLLVLVINWDALTEQTGTSQPDDTGITALQEEAESDEVAEADGTEMPTFEDRTIFPPLTSQTVVESPFGMGSAAAGSAPDANAEPGLHLEVGLPEFPETGIAWRLSVPPDPVTFLETVRARLGLTAEVVEPEEDDRFYALVDEAGNPFVRWDQETAFFDFSGHPDLKTPPPERPETDPEETALHWLTEAGFDVATIEYEASLETTPGMTVVRLQPTNLPDGEIHPGLGMTVGVTNGGAIQFAYGYWLSLEESGEVHLRTAQEAWDVVLAGEGYWPVLAPQPNENMGVRFDSIALNWLLTHADDGEEVTFLLHPVVVFSGMTSESEPKPTRVFVSAVRE